MNYLLDTHTFIWAVQNNDKLPMNIKKIINDYNNDVFISTVSLWEIELKHLKNPKAMPFSAKNILSIFAIADFKLINISAKQILCLEDIVNQGIHRDPFDHFLMATACAEKMTFISHDDSVAKYDHVDVLHY